MMTEQERIEYRERIRAAKASEEREQIRFEHHNRMLESSKSQGYVLPEAPPHKAVGVMRQGSGKGGGKGKKC